MNTTVSHRRSSVALIRDELDRYALLAATAAFTLAAVAAKTGAIVVPGGTLTLGLFPLALLALATLRPHPWLGHELRGAAAWSALALVALTLAPVLTRSPVYAIGLPVVLAASLLAAARPAAATVLAVAVTATLGSFEAFLGVGPGALIDLLLASIWLAVIGRAVAGRPYRFVLWPAVLAFLLFFVVSVIDLLTSDDFAVAYFGFKATVWYMLALLSIAYAGWSRATYRRLARGLVATTCLVTAYVVLRWIIGPSEAERELATVAGNGINVEPYTSSLRVVGPFQTAHALAFWTGFMGPFCLAIALWTKGKWRIAATVGVALCLVAIVASEVRGPLPGLILGALLVVVIYQGARAFPAVGRGGLALAVGATLVLGGCAFTLAASDPERTQRFERILDPGDDVGYVSRQLKWGPVLDSVEQNPFGRGLGTAGAGQLASGSTVELAEFNVDSSYLKIAYEQGLLVMVLFIAVVLALLVSLVVASLRTRSREAAALGMGAAGTLLSVLVSFYSGTYIEATPIVGAWIVIGLGMSWFLSPPTAAPSHEP